MGDGNIVILATAIVDGIDGLNMSDQHKESNSFTYETKNSHIGTAIQGELTVI